jgi:rod shape-determining protein MreD
VTALRRVVFVLVVLGAQGALGVVLPTWVSPPDLFLLAALAATARLTPLWTLGVGYAIGLLQDILGAGVLGFHASGVMTGVLVAGFVRRGLSSENSLNLAISLFSALIAKWLVFIALGYWTRLEAMSVETLLYRFIPEVLTTLAVGPLFFAGVNWAFGKSRGNEDRLL